MRLKDFFSVPTGQKVTEKCLRRVLGFSICSILLCMTCLVSTTWAWFTVSVENQENSIQIAKINASVDIKKDNEAVPSKAEGSYSLVPGAYEVHISLKQEGASDAASVQGTSQNPVYVVMTVTHGGETVCRFVTFSDRSRTLSYGVQVAGGDAQVSFSVSWIEPASASPVGSSETVEIGKAPVETEKEPATDPVTVPSTEGSTATVPEETIVPTETESVTVPEETTEAPATETTAPPTAETTETTETTEATTESQDIPDTTETNG